MVYIIIFIDDIIIKSNLNEGRQRYKTRTFATLCYE